MTHYHQAKEADFAQLKTLTLTLLNDQGGRHTSWVRSLIGGNFNKILESCPDC